jgi:hypothetical protein
MTTTPTRRPPMKSSDEATQKQLALARAQGRAYVTALQHMVSEEAHGSEKHAGDFIVAYAVEAAEGMYRLHGEELMWHEPENENVHIEISVRDGADGRFVPGLTVYVTLFDAQDRQLGRHQQPFLWHPWLYHYGRNWQVPADGTYRLHVRIEPAEFHRHDKENGRRYAKPVEVEFKEVAIETGQK